MLTGQPATTPLTDLLGQPITDPFGQPGFPGFDGMSAAVALAYVAAMQEHGISVTYAYISDAHDFHGVAGDQHVAFGPGSQGYVDQLKAYDEAFEAFFNRLAAAGITKHNTLFIFTVDEGDHFVGVQKTNCDGVTTPCVYGTNEVGEINVNIDTLVQHQFPALASQFLGGAAPHAFTVHGDDAPTFYLAKKGGGGGPLGQTDALTRQFEQQDSYTHDGRVLIEMIDESVLPVHLRSRKPRVHELVNIYKQLNAPFGQFSLTSLKVSTSALASTTPNDTAYTALEGKIASWTTQRDTLTTAMQTMLDKAAFQNQPLDEVQAEHLIDQAEALLDAVSDCAANIAGCAM